MLKSLIVKALRKLLKGLETKPLTVTEYCNKSVGEYNHSATFGEAHTNQVNLEVTATTMQERILEGDEIKECIADIRAEILVKGYKEIPEILSQYPTCVIQAFVTMQKVSLGDYHPEQDNMDSHTREMLIDMSVQLNQLQFRQRMIESGKGAITKSQIDAINKLSEQLGISIPMPTDKFSASEVIEKLIKQAPKKEKAMVGNITEPQFRRLQYLTSKLGKKMPLCKDIAEASALIGELQTELDNHPELVNEPATKEQVDYVKRLLKMQNKRWTDKREVEYTAMTKSQISVAIKELQQQIPSELLASEGQVEYIVFLCQKMDLPYNVEELKRIKKEEATTKINSLCRDYLYILAKTNGTMLSKEEIALMPSNAVKEMIKSILMERKTGCYTKDVEEVF